MPPKTWEDESDETSSGSEEEESPRRPVVAAARRKFDDEEDSDNVVESWDAEDSEEERKKAAKEAAAKAKAAAEAAANKKTKSQRIEEHIEEKRRRRAAEDDDDSEEEDEATKRARMRQMEGDADLKHAQDLFGNVGLKSRSTNKATLIDDKDNPGQKINLADHPLFRPATKSQFEQLSAVLIPVLQGSSSMPHYSIWVQDFVKKITADLPSTEIKKAASGLTALSNEKLKEEKAQEKGGKKTKGAKKNVLSASRDVGRGKADTTAYEGNDLDDDDFM